MMVRLLALAFLLIPGAARAGSVLDRVRAEGVLHCGGTVRPGLAFPARDGSWHGLDVDICRAVATAALGPNARIDFRDYTLQQSSFDGARTGGNELSFLTASEILYAGLLPAVLPGPPVYYLSTGMMVLQGSPAQHLADLRNQMVCAEPGTGQERSLQAWFASRQVPVHYFMFQESDEMLDAFYAGRCAAIAHEVPSLAAIGLQAEEDGHASRLLPEPLATVPLMASTPQGDGNWAAIVAWTVATLQRAEMAGSAAPGGGAEPLPLAGPALGLRAGWQNDVLHAVGSYADIYRRNLGADSPLDLPRGANALSTAGGLFCPPFSE